MAAKRIEYQIVGRYKDGKEVTDYHLQSIDSGKSGKFSREIVCYLAGRGQITNCTAQVYKDQVILRGNGMSLDDLPIINEDGELKNADGLGRVKKGTSAVDALEMFNIVGIVKSGRTVAGYVLQNAGCGIKKFKRPQVIEMARAGKIGNARVQTSNGREILRGIDCKLDELPVEKDSQSVKEEYNSCADQVFKNTVLKNSTLSHYDALYKIATDINNNGRKFRCTEQQLDRFGIIRFDDDSIDGIKLVLMVNKTYECKLEIIPLSTEYSHLDSTTRLGVINNENRVAEVAKNIKNKINSLGL